MINIKMLNNKDIYLLTRNKKKAFAISSFAYSRIVARQSHCSDKHETAHARKREPFACLFSTTY